MERINGWMILALILVAGMLLVACSSPSPVHPEAPAHVEPIEGTELSRVILTEKAAERIAVETVPVREEDVVRKRTFGGQVVDASSSVLVRVALSGSDLETVDRTQPVMIRPLEEGAGSWMGQVVEAPASEEESEGLYCLVDVEQSGLVARQAVFVEVSTLSDGAPRKVIPYSAVLYDMHGGEWVYTSPEPLVYVRAPVVVEYIDGETAVLSEGPPADTEVVTAGGSELYGAESGIGGGGH